MEIGVYRKFRCPVPQSLHILVISGGFPGLVEGLTLQIFPGFLISPITQRGKLRFGNKGSPIPTPCHSVFWYICLIIGLLTIAQSMCSSCCSDTHIFMLRLLLLSCCGSYYTSQRIASTVHLLWIWISPLLIHIPGSPFPMLPVPGSHLLFPACSFRTWLSGSFSKKNY